MGFTRVVDLSKLHFCGTSKLHKGDHSGPRRVLGRSVAQEQNRFGVFAGRGGEKGKGAIRVLTTDDFGAWGRGDFETLGGHRDRAIGSDLDGDAQAPHVRPPRARGFGAQHGPTLTLGEGPGLVGRHGQLTVLLVEVVMAAELIDPGVGLDDLGDALGGKESWETKLPEEVQPFDLTFRLRRRCVEQGDVVELQGPAQLREGVGLLG